MAKKKRIQAAEEYATSAAPVLVSEEKSSAGIFPSAVSVQERIALLAYTYWEQRGQTSGSPEEDWFRAEREILGQMSLADQ